MAAVMGWRVMRFSNQQWERDPAGCMDLIQQALDWRVP
jgi:very-short-patch-repair endonuclease